MEKQHVTETPDTSHIKNVDVTHETSDVQVGSIGKFVIGLFALTVVTYIAVLGMFWMFERNEVKLEQEKPRPTMALTGEERLPPEPRLQGAQGFAESLERKTEKEEPGAKSDAPKGPTWEIDVLRRDWEKTLKDGPVDEHGAPYGMPINKAKEEVLKQLPVRKQ